MTRFYNSSAGLETYRFIMWIVSWWVGLGWLSDPHPAALSLPLLDRTGEEKIR